MTILVTGATGFVGGALVGRVVANGPEGEHAVIAAVRRRSETLPVGARQVVVGDLGADTAWGEALDGVEVVIHAAARVHVMRDRAEEPLSEFRRVNVAGTLNLARQAARAGVKRFVFLSSIKVNGESTVAGRPFRADDEPGPLDPYAISKHEAEEGLKRLAGEGGMEYVIVRPPLVYGPGVKANFLSMMRWLTRGVPLPLGAIRNRRSLVALENLVDLILLCATHPAARNQTFLVSDGEDLSTPELLRRMGRALGVRVRLLDIPPLLLESGAALVGRRGVAERLCGSLQADITKSRELLGWHPPVTIDDGLRGTALHFLETRR